MGQKFAAFDTQGNITAFYDSIDSPTPAGASNVIAITDSQWQTCISQPGQWHVVSGALAQVPPPSAAQLLASAQTLQNATLNAACAAAITSGFSSSALGSAYNYPSTLTDQANQNTLAQCASGGMLWCATGGAWSFKQHTQAQVQAVVASFSAWLNKCQQQLVAFTSQVGAATTVSAVESIAWTNPA
ncbi:DUF4376 domain-containing protein [Burkholderia vietnamiensis]|uniref:DUF4376 domain-containing protein n=1 Tax=Burkholderia vietnamiensis TaxID=60552 RepID=UPI001CF32BE2|nr:hypothetical protein [Burkholderia vietnamiensis]MCA8013297.1 hypothetical protein [Burkholderia vietnamiensis]MCA8266405.1 hypothetical protein [Burkholderia vietnamiensis]